MKKLYFIPGSQDLYGEECLRQMAEDCARLLERIDRKYEELLADVPYCGAKHKVSNPNM